MCKFETHLIHWGWVTHICGSELTIISSDNNLSPGRPQAIIWTNARILLNGPLWTNFSEILLEIYIFSLKKMHLQMFRGKCRPFCLSLNVLRCQVLEPSPWNATNPHWWCINTGSDNGLMPSVIKPLSAWWRHQMETFSALLALCAGNSPVPVNSPHKGQWRGALMFSLICARINDWVNNREAGDLRPHPGHYDVSVMEPK